jgi:hypothetical protein
MLVVIVGVIAFINLFVDYSSDKLTAIRTFFTVSEETSRIQQEYTNLMAYNWIKTVSYEANMPASPYTETLLIDAMTAFSQSTIVKMIEQSYSEDFSLKILNGNVCRLFKNPAYC